jgi:hypothetical protein
MKLYVLPFHTSNNSTRRSESMGEKHSLAKIAKEQATASDHMEILQPIIAPIPCTDVVVILFVSFVVCSHERKGCAGED